MRLTLAWVLLAFTALCGRVSAQDAAGERVGGQVVSTRDGRPLARAVVSLEQVGSRQTAATVYTGEDGRFRFEPVAKGKYTLRGRAAGYIASVYLEHGGFGTAIVTGAGLATGALRLDLTPSSSIAGRVMDEAGEPMARAMVQLYREDVTDPLRVGRLRTQATGDEGRYSFVNLPPGRYFVSASGTPWYAVHPQLEQNGMPYRQAVDPALDVAYPMVFYPSALDSGGATAIPLKGGDDFVANLQMVPERALMLSIEGGGDTESGAERFHRFPQLTRDVFGVPEPVQAQTEDMNGVQRIVGIPPGHYGVQEFRQGTGVPVRSGSVDVTASTTFALPPPPPTASVAMTVKLAAGGALPPVTSVSLRAMEGGGARGRGRMQQQVSGALDDKNTAHWDAVPLGEYRPQVFAARGPLTVIGVTVNGKAASIERLKVTGTDALTMEVTVASGTVKVEGLVRREGKPDAGAMVVLVPAGADTDVELFRRDQSDLDGSFTLGNVVPGNYIAVAIDDGWTLPWSDTATLAKYLLHGVPLTVGLEAVGTVRLGELAAQAR